MTALILCLLFCQVLGAFAGALAAIWSEVAYVIAMKDGKIDIAERVHLEHIGRGLRFGMSLILLSSLALVILSYAVGTVIQPALTASYWIFIALALLIIGISWALSRRKFSFGLGSAAVLTAWWLLVYVTLGDISISFGAALALYFVLTAVIYAVLSAIRFFALQKNN